MPWVGFEPTILAGERPKTYAIDRAATGAGNTYPLQALIILVLFVKVVLRNT